MNNYISLMKDWMPALIGLTALFMSYINVSRQIQKDMKSKWINSFREEISQYLALCLYLSPNSEKEQIQKLAILSMKVRMFLNTKNSLQKELHNLLFSISLDLIKNGNSKEFFKQINDIMELSEAVIQEQQNNI